MNRPAIDMSGKRVDTACMNEISEKTSYHPPTPDAVKCHELIRDTIASALETVQTTVPIGRERSITETKLEEAMFWANAGIARNHGELPSFADE